METAAPPANRVRRRCALTLPRPASPRLEPRQLRRTLGVL